eukprot:gene23885-28982_t
MSQDKPPPHTTPPPAAAKIHFLPGRCDVKKETPLIPESADVTASPSGTRGHLLAGGSPPSSPDVECLCICCSPGPRDPRPASSAHSPPSTPIAAQPQTAVPATAGGIPNSTNRLGVVNFAAWLQGRRTERESKPGFVMTSPADQLARASPAPSPQRIATSVGEASAATSGTRAAAKEKVPAAKTSVGAATAPVAPLEVPDKGDLERRCIHMRWATKQVEAQRPWMTHQQKSKPESLYASAFGCGNITGLVNDIKGCPAPVSGGRETRAMSREDPAMSRAMSRESLAPAMLVEALVCGWPLLFLCTTCDVHRREELLMDYGKEYWDFVKEARQRLVRSIQADDAFAAHEESCAGRQIFRSSDMYTVAAHARPSAGAKSSPVSKMGAVMGSTATPKTALHAAASQAGQLGGPRSRTAPGASGSSVNTGDAAKKVWSESLWPKKLCQAVEEHLGKACCVGYHMEGLLPGNLYLELDSEATVVRALRTMRPLFVPHDVPRTNAIRVGYLEGLASSRRVNRKRGTVKKAD